MNAQPKTITPDGTEVLDPRKVLQEQTLAVDLAAVEIDRAIATAHKYPRSLDVVVKKISTLSCYNEESAASCVYSLPRGKKPIIGPSIGFANIVLQSWGNCRASSQITYIDTKQKVVIAQGMFMDLETNAASVVPVNRRIVDSKGFLYSEDMQIVTGMAAASIARRNAILQGVPRGIWFQIWTEALGIVRGDVSTFEENKEKALKAMAQFGVKPEQVFGYLGLKGEIEMTFEHIPYVRGMYQQLRDGATTVEEMFDPRKMTGRGFETIENPLGAGGEDENTGGEGGEAAASAAGVAARPAQEAPPQSSAEPEEEEGPEDEADELPAEVSGKPLGRPPVGQKASPGPEAKAAPKNEPTAAPPAGKQASEAAAKAGKAAEAPKAAGAPPPATAKAAAAAPRDVEGFLDYWEAFLASAGSATEVQAAWSRDRELRKLCGLMGTDFDKAKAMKEEREAEFIRK